MEQRQTYFEAKYFGSSRLGPGSQTRWQCSSDDGGRAWFEDPQRCAASLVQESISDGITAWVVELAGLGGREGEGADHRLDDSTRQLLTRKPLLALYEAWGGSSRVRTQAFVGR